MREPNNIRKTPRIVDGAADFPDRPPTPDELKYPLPAFFYEMRNVPFDDWTDFQVRRAIGQGDYLAELIPRALEILQDDPLAGGYWEGDLLQLFTEIPGRYWKHYPDQKEEAIKVAQAALLAPTWEYMEEDYKELAAIIRTIASGTIPVLRDFRHNFSFTE